MMYTSAFCALWLCLGISLAQENPEVLTQHGTIIGRVDPTPLGVNVESFKGIPYALPPIGSGRFANPEPYGDYPGGLLDAGSFSDTCWSITPAGPASEDCLYLNIWRPETTSSNRAVMVWIHGGGFFAGSASEPSYDGGILSVFGDVIIVSINYRLGIYGFFNTGDQRMPNGNQGMLDQQMALQWVQENIEAFGGDPRQVTIFGESAGSSSVNHLLLMPETEPLFTRAILQSGDSNAYWAIQSMETAAVVADWVSNRTDCANDESLLECLRDIPSETLFNSTYYFFDKPLFSAFAPVVDGVTLQDRPIDMMESGRMHRKDVILGFNKDEGSVFIYTFPGVDEVTTVEDPIGTYTLVAENHLGRYKNLTEAGVEAVLDAYVPLDENGEDKARISISDMMGDAVFVCSIQRVARAFDQHGMKVYQYYLTYRASNSQGQEWEGVRHFDDVQWVFGIPLNDGLDYEENERILAIEIMTMWTDFAKYGIPDPNWPTYSNAYGPAYVDIRGPSDFVYITGDDVREEYCSLWP